MLNVYDQKEKENFESSKEYILPVYHVYCLLAELTVQILVLILKWEWSYTISSKAVINFHCLPSRITTMCILSLYIIHTINEIMSQTCGTITEYSE